MPVEERRRIALHRVVADAWGEEAADTLFDLVTPAGHELATRQDIAELRTTMEAMDRRWDERIASLEDRWDGRIAALEERWDERITVLGDRTAAMEQRWDERIAALEERWDERMASLEHRLTSTFERRITDAVSLQTRTLVLSQLGALVVIAALAFGLR